MNQKNVALSLILALSILLPAISINLTVANSPTSNALQTVEPTSAWPLFRYDAANTGSSDDTAPVTHDLLWSKNILIDKNAFSIVGSSPAIVNGVVYIGSDDGYLYAFNAFNGDQVWSRKVGGSSVSSPVIVNGLVYVRDWYGNDYALDASTGDEVWNYSAGWSYSSPAVVNGVYYARTSGAVTALDAAEGSLIWTVSLSGNGDGSPLVIDDTIYIADSGFVYALSTQDGALKWSKDLQYMSNTDNTPTVVNGILYITCQSDTLYAFDADTGASIWNCTVGASCHSNTVVSNGFVYVGSGHNGLFAIDALTGNKIWNFPLSPGMGSSVAVAGGNVYLAATNGVMYAIDAAKGTEVWSYTMSNDGTTSSPSVANGILYIRNNNGYLCAFGKASNPSVSLYPAFGLAGTTTTLSGSGFTAASTITVTFKGTPVTVSSSTVDSLGHFSATFQVPDYSPYNYQIIVSDAVGVCASTNFTIVGAPSTSWPMFMHDPKHSGTPDNISPISNNTLWEFSVDKGAIMNGISSSAAVVGGIVYEASQNAFVYALDAYTGSCYWKFSLGSGTLSSPAVVDGVVYIGSDRGVFAINAYLGTKIWQSSPAISTISSPTVCGDMVYVGSFVERSVYAFRVSDGQKVWQYQAGDYVNSSPIVIDGIVYVTSDDGYAYALDAVTGDLIWKVYCLGTVSYESFSSSPAYANSVVYVSTSKGNILALDASSGAKIWNHTATDLSSYTSSPIYYNETVYTSSKNGVYALDAVSGQEIWHSNLFFAQASPSIVNGVIYVGTGDGNIYGLDSQTGNLIWQYTIDGFVRGQTSIVNGVIYVGTGSGKIYAVGTPVNLPASPTDPEPTPSSAVNPSTSPSTSTNTLGETPNSTDQMSIAPESPTILLFGGLIGSIVMAASIGLTRKNHKSP